MTPAPDTAGPPRGAAITLRKRVTLGAALKNGLTVQLSGLKPGVVRASAITGAKVVASGRAKVGRSGRASVKLVFTAKARRQLRDRRSVKLRLSAGKAHGSVTLKR